MEAGLTEQETLKSCLNRRLNDGKDFKPCCVKPKGPMQDNDWCQPMIAHSRGEFVVPRASAALQKHRSDTALALGGCAALQPNSSGHRKGL